MSCDCFVPCHSLFKGDKRAEIAGRLKKQLEDKMQNCSYLNKLLTPSREEYSYNKFSLCQSTGLSEKCWQLKVRSCKIANV